MCFKGVIGCQYYSLGSLCKVYKILWLTSQWLCKNPFYILKKATHFSAYLFKGIVHFEFIFDMF